VAGPAVAAATLEGAERAFRDTRCRIASLKGAPLAECGSPSAPATGGLDAEDVVFVHYSGHGLPGGLVLRNGVLAPRVLEGWVEELGADLVVLLIDACHGAGLTEVPEGNPRAGDWPQVFLTQLFPRRLLEAPRGVALFNAAVHWQLTEVAELNSGQLTHVVLSGLMGGADDDGDQRITFEELSGFFERNTTDAGEFVARTAAPGGDRTRVLLDLRQARTATHVLEVDRRLGGRLLVADPNGAVAEVNVERRRLHEWPTLRLYLPEPVADLYFLDTGGGPIPEVRAQARWDLVREPGRLDGFGGVSVGQEDPLAGYLVETWQQRRLFTSRPMPLREWRPGVGLTLTGSAGYHWTERYGRIEESDVLAAAARDAAQSSSTAGMVERAREETPSAWNLATAGVTLRMHGLHFGHVELRGDLSLAPRTLVQRQEGSSVFMLRGAAGLGLSSYLASPAALLSVSAGTGLHQAWFPSYAQVVPEQFPRQSRRRDLPNGYAALTLRLDLARLRPTIVEVLYLHDQQQLRGLSWSTGDASGVSVELRTYHAAQVRLGFELGRWPR
ncbi:MAG: hypothetical protein H6741_32290, partial [Alphaproteobacteria bacterium]|nr:hypothetical protein [Alphaproteobacteria bacterium]